MPGRAGARHAHNGVGIDELACCEGFGVESSEGRLGVVEGVQTDGSGRRAQAILVRGGISGVLLLVVPVEETEAVLPDEGKVVVRPRSLANFVSELRADGRIVLRPPAARGRPEAGR